MSFSHQPTNLQSTSELQLTAEEAFAGIMLAAVAVDGHLAEPELQNLMTTLKRTKLYKQQSRETIIQTLKKLLKLIKTYDTDTLLKLALPALPEYLSETVFAIATDLTLADGAMFDEELEILSKLSTYLSIPEATVNQITQVMMIKNRG